MLIYSHKKLKEVKYFKTDYFKDFRGQIWTTWEKKYFKNINFNRDKISISKKNVLRGFHGDKKSWKLVTCLRGEVLCVIVDYRSNSKNYLKHAAFKLNDKNKLSVLLPPMFLNSFLCLSKEALYGYKLSFKGTYVDANEQISVKWNDQKINYKWPIKKPILSKRDK